MRESFKDARKLDAQFHGLFHKVYWYKETKGGEPAYMECDYPLPDLIAIGGLEVTVDDVDWDEYVLYCEHYLTFPDSAIKELRDHGINLRLKICSTRNTAQVTLPDGRSAYATTGDSWLRAIFIATIKAYAKRVKKT